MTLESEQERIKRLRELTTKLSHASQFINRYTITSCRMLLGQAAAVMPTLIDAATECLELRESQYHDRKNLAISLDEQVDIREQLAAMTKAKDEATARAERWKSFAIALRNAHEIDGNTFFYISRNLNELLDSEQQESGG